MLASGRRVASDGRPTAMTKQPESHFLWQRLHLPTRRTAFAAPEHHRSGATPIPPCASVRPTRRRPRGRSPGTSRLNWSGHPVRGGYRPPAQVQATHPIEGRGSGGSPEEESFRSTGDERSERSTHSDRQSQPPMGPAVKESSAPHHRRSQCPSRKFRCWWANRAPPTRTSRCRQAPLVEDRACRPERRARPVRGRQLARDWGVRRSSTYGKFPARDLDEWVRLGEFDHVQHAAVA